MPITALIGRSIPQFLFHILPILSNKIKNYRILLTTNFAEGFHTFGVEWQPTFMKFFVDGEYLGGVYPPNGGFWEIGQFSGDNIWKDGYHPINPCRAEYLSRGIS